MKTPLLRFAPLILSLSLLTQTSATAADTPAPALAKRGAILFSDDFARAQPGPKWETSQRAFAIVDGALKGGQLPTQHHPAIAGVELPFRDAVIEFRFRFEGATGISAVCDDRKFEGSHAGHICRVTITPKAIRLGDDKEGAMRPDIIGMRKDPARRAEAEKLLAGRSAAFPTTVSTGEWHRLDLEIVGDQMRASLDGRHIGSLKSPGIAHPTKSRFHFAISGRDVLLDDVKIWTAEPTGTAGGN